MILKHSSKYDEALLSRFFTAYMVHEHNCKIIFSSEKIEVSLVQKVDGKVQYKIMKAADVDRYCAKAEAAKVRIYHNF